MAVAHDNHATVPFASVATITTTLTVAATSNRGLLALLAFNNSTIPSGLTCTWDSGGTNQSMTAVSGATAGQTAGNGGSVSSVIIYGLIAPTSGTSLTFSASWTGNFTGRIGVVSFTGVAQDSVAAVFNNGAGNSDSSVGGSATATVTITTSSGEAVCGVTADNGSAISVTPSDSLIFSAGPGLTIDSGGNYFLSTGGPHALTCAWGGSVDWAIAGTNIKQFTTPETTAGMRVFDLSPSYSARPLQLQQRTWVGRGLRSITYPVVTADTHYDLPPSKMVPFRPDATFSDRTHILLRGQDRMTAAFRKESYELPPKQVPFRIDATFINPLEIQLKGQDKMTAAFRKGSFDQLPPKQVPFRPDYTFANPYEIALFGAVVASTLPSGEQSFDLSPRPPSPPGPTWLFSYGLNLVGLDALPNRIGASDPPVAYPPLEQTWWPYPNTLNLIDNVAFDAKTSIGFSVASTVTTSFLNVGTNNDRALICGLVFNSATIPSNITATWDTGGTPQPLTAIVGASASQTDGQGTGVTASSVILFGLVAPHMGSLTFTASWTGTFTGRCVLASYYGVDQSGGQVTFPNGSGNSDSSAGGSNPATITVATAFGNAIMAVTADNGSGGVAPFMSDTVLFAGIISGTYEYGADYYLSLGVLKTLTGTWGGASDWCMAATDIKASSSAAALLPIKRQFIDLSPSLPRPLRPWQLDTWEKSYPKVLIGQDKLPTGEQSFALTAPREFQNSLRTWLESYQPGSIMPPNAQEDWPNPLGSKQPYAVALRTWIEGPQQTSANPFAQTDWPLPRSNPRPDETWASSYTLSLIGQDLHLAGEQFFERPPTVPWYRDWAFNAQQFYPIPAVVTYPLTTIPNYDWPLPRSPYRLDQTWTASYDLSLIGQDKLPAGEQTYELTPRAPYYEIDLRTWFEEPLSVVATVPARIGRQGDVAPQFPWRGDTWIINLQETTLAPPPVTTRNLAGSQSYDRPPPPTYPGLTWTFSYKLNLIGKDKMIVGEQVTDRPPPVNWYRDWRVNLQQTPFTVTVIPTMPARIGVAEPPPPVNWYKDWVVNLQETTLASAVVYMPSSLIDMSNPIPYPRLAPSWSLNLQNSTLGFVLNPVGASVYRLVPPRVDWYRAWAFNIQQTPFVRYPMPARIGTMDPPLPPQRLDPTWSYSYNLSRIGKDLMLAGEQVYDLTRRYAPLVPSWTYSFPIELTGIGPILGLLAYNRPALRVPSAPSWTWSYNLNLIGKDALPVGEITYDLPRRYAPLVPSWYWSFDLNLLGLGQPPTGVTSFDTPAQRSRMPELTNWNWSYNLRLIGKDRRLTGQQSYDLARGRPIPLLQTWAYNAPAFRIPPTFRIVYTNYDWPLPQRPPRLQQQSFFSNTTPYMPAPTPVVIPTIGDLVLIANQELQFFGEHDTYSSRITQIYLILPHPVEGFPEMTFERPDGSTFKAQFPYVSVGQFTAQTSKGLAIAGHYLVYNVVKTQFYYPGVWRAFAKGDGEGASFYVRTY